MKKKLLVMDFDFSDRKRPVGLLLGGFIFIFILSIRSTKLI
jgi:hypothetical protein